MLGVPRRFADLCLQAFTARQELIDWVKGLIENNVSIHIYKVIEIEDNN